jgi:hypothetical protein
MYTFVKTKIFKNQPNWSNHEELEGEVAVQGLEVFIYKKDENGNYESAGEPVLTYNVELGKWVDKRGEKWDEWSVELDDMF